MHIRQGICRFHRIISSYTLWCKMTLVLWMKSYVMASGKNEWMLQSNDVIGTFMNKCINSYATIKIKWIHKRITPICSIFIFKNYMQEKETITDGIFRLSGDISPRDQKTLLNLLLVNDSYNVCPDGSLLDILSRK